MATDNPLLVDVFPIKTSINRGFPIATFNYQRDPEGIKLEKNGKQASCQSSELWAGSISLIRFDYATALALKLPASCLVIP